MTPRPGGQTERYAKKPRQASGLFDLIEMKSNAAVRKRYAKSAPSNARRTTESKAMA